MPAAAQAVKLDGDEIRALLMGNTAIGRWEGWFVMEYGHTDYWVSRATLPTPLTGKAWWRSDQSCFNFAALLPIIAQANCDPLMMLKSENLGGDQPGLCLVSRTLEGPQTHATGPFGLGLMRQPYLRIV